LGFAEPRLFVRLFADINYHNVLRTAYEATLESLVVEE